MDDKESTDTQARNLMLKVKVRNVAAADGTKCTSLTDNHYAAVEWVP